MMCVLTSLIVVIILQRVYTLNHHIIQLKYIQFNLSFISQQSWENKSPCRDTVSQETTYWEQREKYSCVTHTVIFLLKCRYVTFQVNKVWIHSFTPSFLQCTLNSYYIPGPPGTGRGGSADGLSFSCGITGIVLLRQLFLTWERTPAPHCQPTPPCGTLENTY
jgi:hypothetical protein